MIEAPPQSPPHSALIVAHPGHELRAYGWLERARPVVFVLTDGSGHEGASRLGSTALLLAAAGARPGAIFGRLSDRALYAALLARDVATFIALARELAEGLAAAGVSIVVGDALEGFNPGHDSTRLLIDAAVARIARSGRAIASYELLLDAHPLAAPADPEVAADPDRLPDLVVDLDAAAFARKLAAARAYPEMAGEVESALERFGEAAFRHEVLRPARSALRSTPLYRGKPFFESHGERRVAEGHYRDVVRGADHLEPLAAALARWAEAS